jgi:hypothetical protein
MAKTTLAGAVNRFSVSITEAVGFRMVGIPFHYFLRSLHAAQTPALKN